MMKHWVRSSKTSEQHMTLHRKLGHVAEIAEKYKKSTTGREKMLGHEQGSCWPERASSKKKALFFEQSRPACLRDSASCESHRRGNPGRRRRCSWENSDKTNRDNFHQCHSRIDKISITLFLLLAKRIPSVS